MADLDFVVNLQGEDLRGTEYLSRKQDFWNLRNHDIPPTPGAYIFLAHGTRLRYPRGTNSVYYIGQSKTLRQRLRTHLTYAEQARDDRQGPLYYQRYEYAAAFGTHYCYVHTWSGLTPRALEEHLLARFSEKAPQLPHCEQRRRLETHLAKPKTN